MITQMINQNFMNESLSSSFHISCNIVFRKKVFLSQQNEQSSLKANFPVLQFVQAKLVEGNGLLNISTQTLTKKDPYIFWHHGNISKSKMITIHLFLFIQDNKIRDTKDFWFSKYEFCKHIISIICASKASKNIQNDVLFWYKNILL